MHSSDAEELALIRVKACVSYDLGNSGLIGIATIAATFDQFEADPLIAGDGLLEFVLVDVVDPRDQLVCTGENDLDFRIL